MLPPPQLTPSTVINPSPSPPATPSFEPAPGQPLSTLDYSWSISSLLREGTRRAHESVEHSPGAARLAKGELGREEYAKWCVALWYIYDALESGLSLNSNNTVLGPTYHPSLLSRAPPLEADISFLLGTPEWKSHPIPASLLRSPPNRCRKTPERLLAHAYVRYLGDLSGGQIIKRRLARKLSLASDSSAGNEDGPIPGLAFFSFPPLFVGAGQADLSEMQKIKQWFRAGMDEGVGNDETLKRALVEEANLAFDLNAGLFRMVDEDTTSANEKREPAVIEEVYSPLSKLSSGKQDVKAESGQKGYSLASFVAFLVAVGLAHFLIVTLGLTGQRGWEKWEIIRDWVMNAMNVSGRCSR